MRKIAAGPVRHYEIQADLSYPLRDAARACDLPRSKLRLAILLSEIDAEPVDDDREYLLRGGALQDYLRALRPMERPRFEGAPDAVGVVGVFLAIPLVALLLLAGLQSLPVAPTGQSLPSPPPEEIDQSVPLPRRETPPPKEEGPKIPRDRTREGLPGW
jgi:hypothetical protein